LVEQDVNLPDHQIRNDLRRRAATGHKLKADREEIAAAIWEGLAGPAHVCLPLFGFSQALAAGCSLIIASQSS
jgi:hypothetical protein